MSETTGKNKLKVRQVDLDTLYPIDSTYLQFPIAGSNTILTALPSSQNPATLYGGTWEEIWNTEAVFFRTEGKHLEAAETTNRTDGKQDDYSQSHLHEIYGEALADEAGNFEVRGAGNASGVSSSAPKTDSSYGTPRAGLENYPVNRIIKIWKRTA